MLHSRISEAKLTYVSEIKPKERSEEQKQTFLGQSELHTCGSVRERIIIHAAYLIGTHVCICFYTFTSIYGSMIV